MWYACKIRINQPFTLTTTTSYLIIVARQLTLHNNHSLIFIVYFDQSSHLYARTCVRSQWYYIWWMTLYLWTDFLLGILITLVPVNVRQNCKHILCAHPWYTVCSPHFFWDNVLHFQISQVQYSTFLSW